MTNSRHQFIDLFILTLIASVITLWQISGHAIPFEDAAILLRYADNFANGHGIVWNIGEAPVDGATDFLFMLMVGLLAKTGLTVEIAARSLTIAAHLATVAVVYLFSRKWQATRATAIIASALVIIGPGRFYITAYFGATVFALFGLLAWCLMLEMVQTGNFRLKIPFVLFCFIAALIRPEGNFLALFMLIGMIYLVGWKKALPVTISFVLIFGLLGGIYLFWRYSYFGYLLPNPFYIKGGFDWDNLMASLLRASALTLPLIVAAPFLIWHKVTRRETGALLIVILGFAAMFGFVSNQMNFAARFQYALFPISIVSGVRIAGVLSQHFSDEGKRIMAGLRLAFRPALVVLFGYMLLLDFRFSSRLGHDSIYDVANYLSRFQNKGYTLVTTEAGLLPLYSHWRSIDAFGLNDKWIAHNGGITMEYMRQIHPHLILMHGSYKPLDDWSFIGSDPWPSMLQVIEEYARENHYILAAAFGISPTSVHYYYVRPDCEDANEIVAAIGNMEYFKYGSTELSTNFAAVKSP